MVYLSKCKPFIPQSHDRPVSRSFPFYRRMVIRGKALKTNKKRLGQAMPERRPTMPVFSFSLFGVDSTNLSCKGITVSFTPFEGRIGVAKTLACYGAAVLFALAVATLL